MRFKRVFLIVCDSLGVGEAQDALNYGDIGANTLKHINDKHNIFIPNLKKLGFLDTINMNEDEDVEAYYTIARPNNKGKDTLNGHYEIVGLRNEVPFKTFTEHGFPDELIKEIETQTGRKVIGNYAASGTEILKELGEEHIKTGAMIVYTSADSVLQIACHEEYFGLDELYRCCEIAREICMKPEWMVGRIIARPFLGKTKDTFKRTTNRHDYALSPTSRTTLDELKDKGYSVVSIGKIKDIFNGCGITDAYKNLSNHNGMEHAFSVAKQDFTGLVFSNLVDFDALYGHRRDPKGYHDAIEEFDRDLKTLMDLLNDDDLLMITADHGNDPTWSGTDHTREYVPILVWGKKLKGGNLGTRRSFADIGATIAENFNVKAPEVIGKSFLSELK